MKTGSKLFVSLHFFPPVDFRYTIGIFQSLWSISVVGKWVEAALSFFIGGTHISPAPLCGHPR